MSKQSRFTIVKNLIIQSWICCVFYTVSQVTQQKDKITFFNIFFSNKFYFLISFCFAVYYFLFNVLYYEENPIYFYVLSTILFLLNMYYYIIMVKNAMTVKTGSWP